ncbi:heat shock factor protein 5 isoform X2 [Centropristis striata]|uniref:heat shock factor protein 5 isoform X2 n=1 Tax=Centropristis striata TaxID=184440 RepID=UPI0027E00931|nr:heat shock factor protein 5 isoform X2 [Centropristis striata]
MDACQSPLPDSINPNNFPAKLWRLLNNPAYEAIFWDGAGKVIVINQHLFEKQILCPSTSTSDNADAFKTTNFSSFIRQLNLYGFRKAEPTIKDSGDSAAFHFFFNPNFKRDHPELVASLRRLTVDNKAKMHAGLDVKSRPACSPLFGPTHQASTHPYYPNKAQAMTPHNGTPVPPRFLIRGHGAAHSPTVFATDKGIPVALSHHHAGGASSSNAVHIQQTLHAHASNGNPNFSFNATNAQYQPAYYPPVCQCYHSNFVTSHMAGSGLQTGTFSPSFYQASYPVNMLCRLDNNQDIKEEEQQEVKKCDINLDTIFQIADEVMLTQPNNTVVKVETPVKSVPVFGTLSNAMLCDKPASTLKVVCPILTSSHPDLVTIRQQEESEQMHEVTIDVENDTQVKYVQVSDTVGDTSQADNSRCTGSTPNL